MLQLGRLAAEVFQHLTDKRAGSGGGVEDFHVLVDEISLEMFLAQVVGAFDHEADDFIRRVDDAQSIGGLGVIDLVEVLVDDFQERLLLVVRADLRGGGADGGVVGRHAFQRLDIWCRL